MTAQLQLERYQMESCRLYNMCLSEDENKYEQGLSDLLVHLRRSVHRLAAKYPAATQIYLEEESCQNAIAKIWKSKANCERKESFLAYCQQIARNEYLSVLEREGLCVWRPNPAESRIDLGRLGIKWVNVDSLDRPLGNETDTMIGERVIDSTALAEQYVVDQDWVEWVLSRIARSTHMSARSKCVLLRGFVCEATDEELARALKVTPKNVTVIRTRDRASIRRNDPQLMDEIRHRYRHVANAD